MSDEWVCCCGSGWSSSAHRRQMVYEVGNSLWRDSPALLTPYRQWIREHLPGGHQGFVLCGDDGMIRLFDPTDRSDLGSLRLLEWKSWGRRLDHATNMTVNALAAGRIGDPVVVRLCGGNVPSAIKHYPFAVDVLGDMLPEQPVVADRIVVNGADCTVDHLINVMLGR